MRSAVVAVLAKCRDLYLALGDCLGLGARITNLLFVSDDAGVMKNENTNLVELMRGNVLSTQTRGTELNVGVCIAGVSYVGKAEINSALFLNDMPFALTRQTKSLQLLCRSSTC